MTDYLRELRTFVFEECRDLATHPLYRFSERLAMTLDRVDSRIESVAEKMETLQGAAVALREENKSLRDQNAVLQRILTAAAKPVPTSGLVIHCSRCGVQIQEPAALLFSPPNDNMCVKWHVCHSCYTQHLLPVMGAL